MMPAVPAPTSKSARLNIRATNSEKTLVEEAARAIHVTASQFVLQAALRSAEEVLADRTRFVLPPDMWAAFIDMLDRPPQEIAAIVAASSKPSPLRAS